MSKEDDDTSDDEYDPRLKSFGEYLGRAQALFGAKVSEKDVALAFSQGVKLPKRVGGHDKGRGKAEEKGQARAGKSGDDHAIAQGKKWREWRKKIPGVDAHGKKEDRAEELAGEYASATQRAADAARSAKASRPDARHNPAEQKRVAEINDLKEKIKKAESRVKGLERKAKVPGEVISGLGGARSNLDRLREQLREAERPTPSASSARSGPARPRVPASASGSSRAAPTPASAPAASAAVLHLPTVDSAAAASSQAGPPPSAEGSSLVAWASAGAEARMAASAGYQLAVNARGVVHDPDAAPGLPLVSLAVEEVPGAGDCLYIACSRQLLRSRVREDASAAEREKYSPESLRAGAAVYARANLAESFTPVEIAEVGVQGVQAGHAAMQALANSYNVRVEVVEVRDVFGEDGHQTRTLGVTCVEPVPQSPGTVAVALAHYEAAAPGAIPGGHFDILTRVTNMDQYRRALARAEEERRLLGRSSAQHLAALRDAGVECVEAALPPRGIGAHAAAASAADEPPYRAGAAAAAAHLLVIKRDSQEQDPLKEPPPKRSQAHSRAFDEEAVDSADAAAPAFGSHLPPSTPLRAALHPAGIVDSAQRRTPDSALRRMFTVRRESSGSVRRNILGTHDGAPRPSGKRSWEAGFSQGAAAAPASPSHRPQSDDEEQLDSPTHSPSSPRGQGRGRGGESKRGRGGRRR